MTTMRIAFLRKARIRATAGAAATLLAIGLTPMLAEAAPTAAECTERLGSVATLPSVTYGDRMVAALTSSRRFAAECYAGPQVTSMLFSEQTTGTAWRRVGAESGFGYTHITYAGPGSTQLILTVLLGDRPNDGWGAVTNAEVDLSTGPVSAYVDRLAAAWRANDRAAALEVARPKVVNKLWTLRHRTEPWQASAITAGDRDWTMAWITNGADWFLGVIVNAAAAAHGTPQAITSLMVD